MVVYLTEFYSLATAIFGGFTPTICTYLIHLTGNKAIPGAWVSFAAAVGLIAVLFTFLGTPVQKSGNASRITPAVDSPAAFPPHSHRCS
jgi:hypothetical protein